MLNYLLKLLIGRNLDEISKRLVAFLVSTLSSVSLPLANVGLHLGIDQATLSVVILGIVTSTFKYIESETARPSNK